MPKYTKLEQFPMGIEYKKCAIHINRKEMEEIIEVSQLLKLDDFTSVVKTCIKLAHLHLNTKKERIEEIKELIKKYGLEFKDLD